VAGADCRLHSGINEDCGGLADDEPVCGGSGEDHSATAVDLPETSEGNTVAFGP